LPLRGPKMVSVLHLAALMAVCKPGMLSPEAMFSATELMPDRFIPRHGPPMAHTSLLAVRRRQYRCGKLLRGGVYVLTLAIPVLLSLWHGHLIAGILPRGVMIRQCRYGKWLQESYSPLITVTANGCEL